MPRLFKEEVRLVEVRLLMLNWDATYEIVLSLMEKYPDQDLDQLGLGQLNQLVVQLPNFADDPCLVNDGILLAILREWYEERQS